MPSVFFVLKIIGVIAFAISGALIAIKAKFDVFGVVVIGMVTSSGGGITRDVIAGQTPPDIFNSWWLLAVAALTSIVVFAISYRYKSQFDTMKNKIDLVNNYFDAAGLAMFSIMGVEFAFAYGLSDNALLAITLGVISGVGGGLMRDLLTESLPYIFTKHIYAIASLLGVVTYYCLRYFLPQLNVLIPTFIGIIIIFSLRVFATLYHWKLPKIEV